MTDKTQDVALMNDTFFNVFCEDVTEDKLGGFLIGKFFGSVLKACEFETAIYAKSQSGAISIGECVWRLAAVEDTNTFFMYPNISGNFVIHNKFDSYLVDNRVLGLIVTLRVLRSMHGEYVIQNKELAERYWALYSELTDAFYLLINNTCYNTISVLVEEEMEEMKTTAAVVKNYLQD